MVIKKIGNKYMCFAPGGKRIPGQYDLKSQAITAYKHYISNTINQEVECEYHRTADEYRA